MDTCNIATPKVYNTCFSVAVNAAANSSIERIQSLYDSLIADFSVRDFEAEASYYQFPIGSNIST